ncbi:MAG: DUF2723 domain-containing protein [Elusimicrobiota bacterium]
MRDAGIIFAAFAGLGIFGMGPSVSFGDSGELIAAAATLSIPHAPGYPLFCLTGRALGAALPWAAWGYRVNLLSVLCAAAALAILFDALRRARIPRVGAAAGVLFLGLSPLWLHTSLQTEVFALNGLFAAAGLWIFVRYRDRFFDARPMAALGLCLGLGGANHHTLVLAVPALLAAGWFHARRAAAGPGAESEARPCWAARAARGLALMVAFALAGLTAYLYLPIRARAFPPLDWGHPADLPSLLHVLLRRDYGSFSLTVEGASSGRWAGLWSQTARYLGTLYAGLGPFGLALALLGVASYRFRAREGPSVTWRLPVWLAVLAGPGFLWLGNPPFDAQTTGALERFHLLSWFGVAWLLAAGAGWLASLGRGGRAAALALLLVPAVSAVRTAPAWGQRWDLAADDYGRNLLRSLPRGALLFIDGGDDTFYTLAYLLYAERRRPDLEVHDRGGLVFPNIYGADFRRLAKDRKEERRRDIEAAAARARPTFYSTLNDGVLPGFELPLSGLLRQVGSARAGGRRELVEAAHGRALWAVYPRRFSAERALSHYRYRALIPVYPTMRAAADAARGAFGSALMRLRLAAAVGPDVRWIGSTAAQVAQWVGYRSSRAGDWKVAERAYRFAAGRQPDNADTWLNLGVAMEKQDRLRDAEQTYRRGLEIAPESFQAHYNLGALYWTQQRWDLAAAMFEEASRMRPEDAGVRSFSRRARHRAGARGEP